MNFQNIIAKIFGNPKMQRKASVGWGGWLDTAAGKKWEAIGEMVYDKLEEAKINVHKRQIIFGEPTSAKLTINQMARRLVDKTGEDVKVIREHLMLWLEEAADSDNEERDEDVDMDSAIARWISDVKKTKS